MIRKALKKEASKNPLLNLLKNLLKRKEPSSLSLSKTSKSYTKSPEQTGQPFLTFAFPTSKKNHLTNTSCKRSSTSDSGPKPASKMKTPQNCAGRSQSSELIRLLSSETLGYKRSKKKRENRGKTQSQEEPKEPKSQEGDSSLCKRNKTVNNSHNKKSKSSMHQD